MYIHEIIKVNSSAKTYPAYGVMCLAQKMNEYQSQQMSLAKLRSLHNPMHLSGMRKPLAEGSARCCL